MYIFHEYIHVYSEIYLTVQPVALSAAPKLSAGPVTVSKVGPHMDCDEAEGMAKA